MSAKTLFRHFGKLSAPQSSITKKRFKNLTKIIGIGLFTLLMLTNIKFALLDDNEIASGDISVFGIEMQLFEATYGEAAPQTTCDYLGCPNTGWHLCQYIYTEGWCTWAH